MQLCGPQASQQLWSLGARVPQASTFAFSKATAEGLLPGLPSRSPPFTGPACLVKA